MDSGQSACLPLAVPFTRHISAQGAYGGVPHSESHSATDGPQSVTLVSLVPLVFSAKWVSSHLPLHLPEPFLRVIS